MQNCNSACLKPALLRINARRRRLFQDAGDLHSMRALRIASLQALEHGHSLFMAPQPLLQHAHDQGIHIRRQWMTGKTLIKAPQQLQRQRAVIRFPGIFRQRMLVY